MAQLSEIPWTRLHMALTLARQSSTTGAPVQHGAPAAAEAHGVQVVRAGILQAQRARALPWRVGFCRAPAQRVPQPLRCLQALCRSTALSKTLPCKHHPAPWQEDLRIGPCTSLIHITRSAWLL